MQPLPGTLSSFSKTALNPSGSHPRRFLQRKPRRVRLARDEQKEAIDVSIVIPFLNERENLPSLVRRLIAAFETTSYRYELIFVDDHSSDHPEQSLSSVQHWNDRVHFLRNDGKQGKSLSLLRGFRAADGTVMVMIDADLQYPPEAIPDMVRLVLEDRCDIVVANRRQRKTSFLRSLYSRVFRWVFGRLLLSLNADVQSGLKAFRTTVFQSVHMKPSPWGFDYEFLYRAARHGFRVGQVDITFEERKHGKSHVRPLKTAIELVWGALKLRASYIPRDFFPFLYSRHGSEYRAPGLKPTADYLFLPEIMSTRRHLYPETMSLAIVSTIVFTAMLMGMSVLSGLSPLVILSTVFAVLYVGLMVFKLRMVLRSLSIGPMRFSKRQVAAINDDDLPMYTIIIPLYQEAEVIPQIIAAMTAIDYPPEKLDVMITLEEYDHDTQQAIAAASPPAHFRTVILPDVKPKTKAKALNVAFLQAKGEFIVIYDAEIIPDADQLKKAYLGFRARPDIACLQTSLDHYNANQSWITKLFNAEFSFHYDLFLPGLENGGHALPLSGHSTHFRTAVLADVGAWDPYNLTEDCDIGIRLFRKGYKSGTIDSRSQEEATGDMRSWIIQRSRWMKGFIQTSIVHLRHPLRLKRELGGWRQFFTFLLIVPGSVAMNIVNLFYWGLLAAWFATRSPLIQSLFPAPVLYTSIVSLAFGNFAFMYLNLVGLYRRERFALVKYGLLSYVYWLMLGYAAVRACVHLIIKPYHWEKTRHGTHLPTPTYAPNLGIAS